MRVCLAYDTLICTCVGHQTLCADRHLFHLAVLANDIVQFSHEYHAEASEIAEGVALFVPLRRYFLPHFPCIGAVLIS